MTDTALHWQTLAELAPQLRRGTLSPVALVEHLLARIEALDGTLHAFRLVTRQRALDAAHAAERALRAGVDLGPLHGLPFAVKDIIDVQGLPTTAGSDLLRDHVASADATVVRRLQQAGMVLLGKVHTVQFALGAPGINHHHGTPHNPWHPTPHVPGGSSSGSGVAVAAGLVPVALGTDTGGSVRIPAALCGVVGLKPSMGQVSRAGVFPLSWTLDSVGPLARSVEDAALVYQALRGPDPADATTHGAPLQDVLAGLKDGVRGLRLVLAEGVLWEDVDPELAAAVRAAGEVLADLGAHVDRRPFALAAEALEANARGLLSLAEAYVVHHERLGERFEAYDPVVQYRILAGKAASAADYLQALRAHEALKVKAQEALRDIDALLAPTTAVPARPVAEVDASLETYQAWNPRYSRNTRVANMLGLCALSVPCGLTAKGLPIGLMIMGKAGDEATVLRVGYAYEQATAWHRHHPDLGWCGG
ncbi:MAG: amidase [Candidatus Tectimicrobiota bacterium]|nr:MAG: amidase [Candidatus Tectomicrobia bacterium]